MSNYTQITDFSAKDALASGDANKKILGSDVDAELAAISTAIATKGDDSGLVHTTGTETVAGNKTFSGTNTHSGAATFSGGATVSSGQTLEVSGVLTLSKGADIASANDLALGTDGNYFDITGTTTLTGMTDKAAGTVIKLHFDGALTITHAGSPSAGYTKFYCPSAGDYTTTAGDELTFVYESTDGWRVTNVLKQADERIAFYTSSDTFVVPPGITKVKVTGIAGGGGGGGTNSGPAGGGGGGSGGVARSMIVTGLTPGASVTVTIGAGGAGGVGASNGSTGGTTSFGSYVTLVGGGGGVQGGGAGGAAGTTTCDTFFTSGTFTTGFAGGAGDGSNAGGGASDRLVGIDTSVSTVTGEWGLGGQAKSTTPAGAATGFGAGGGGCNYTGGPGTGGAGAGGFLIVEW